MNEEKNLTSKGEKRRDAIIQASMLLFSKNGFEKTSLDMIIAEAGGSRRMIYSEFGSKEGLLQAVLADCSDLLSEPLRNIRLADEGIDKSLQAIGEAMVTNLLAPERINFFRMLLHEAPRFPGIGLQFLRMGPGMSYQLLGEYFDTQVKNGTLKLGNTTEAATGFIELCKGDLLLQALFDPGFAIDHAQIRRLVKTSVAIFLDGCRQQPQT